MENTTAEISRYYHRELNNGTISYTENKIKQKDGFNKMLISTR